MRQPKKRLTKSKTAEVVTYRKPRFADALYTPEMYAQMQEMEAREWATRYAIKIGELGLESAKFWLEGVVNDIEKKRGIIVANQLKDGIKREYRVLRDPTNAFTQGAA